MRRSLPNPSVSLRPCAAASTSSHCAGRHLPVSGAHQNGAATCGYRRVGWCAWWAWRCRSVAVGALSAGALSRSESAGLRRRLWSRAIPLSPSTTRVEYTTETGTKGGGWSVVRRRLIVTQNRSRGKVEFDLDVAEVVGTTGDRGVRHARSRGGERGGRPSSRRNPA